jgi:hypothetical protein
MAVSVMTFLSFPIAGLAPSRCFGEDWQGGPDDRKVYTAICNTRTSPGEERSQPPATQIGLEVEMFGERETTARALSGPVV